jgi:hypothetical protein
VDDDNFLQIKWRRAVSPCLLLVQSHAHIMFDDFQVFLTHTFASLCKNSAFLDLLFLNTSRLVWQFWISKNAWNMEWLIMYEC